MSFDLFESFKSTLHRQALWTPGQAVLVAASGGPDSTALLLLFSRLREESPFSLAAAHLNHALRGEESDADENFVAGLAMRLRIPFHASRLSPGMLQDVPEGLEAAARTARYAFLRQTAARLGAPRVALGHTRDDQAETLLIRLLRGSGRRGLGGVHPLFQDLFVRPLLGFSRDTVRGYLDESGENWRVDSSNEDLRRTRNRIRRRLLPLLREDYNPDVASVLARTADVLREEDDYLDAVTRDLARRLIRQEETGLTLAIPAVRVLPQALRRRLLRSFLEQAIGDAPPPDYETTAHLESLVEEARHRAAITISERLEIRVLYSDLVAIARRSSPKVELVPLPVPGEAALPELGVCVRARQASLAEAGDPKLVASPVKALLDADAVPGPLGVRHRKEGDLFRPLGSSGESKLKSFFIDRKVPSPMRDRVPLVVSGDRIAWVVGYQIDDRFKVTPQTRRVLVLSKELP